MTTFLYNTSEGLECIICGSMLCTGDMRALSLWRHCKLWPYAPQNNVTVCTNVWNKGYIKYETRTKLCILIPILWSKIAVNVIFFYHGCNTECMRRVTEQTLNETEVSRFKFFVSLLPKMYLIKMWEFSVVNHLHNSFN